MRKNGFTLIELLAVIVILAIIALIATPIILGIINDAREKANERSVELYASAVRNGIAAYQLTNLNSPTSFDDLDIQYDGDVKCTVQELYEDGSFYIADCTVNGFEVDYTYGEKQVTQVYKPQYYHYELDFFGTVGELITLENLSNVPPIGEIRYLGFDVTNGVVSTSYVCFVRNEIEYCLKGNDDDMYTKNVEIIKDAYADVVDTEACSFYDVNDGYTSDAYGCDVDNLSASVDSTGTVNVQFDSVYCYVNDYGDSVGFGCGGF